jgi:hypothetical protein
LNGTAVTETGSAQAVVSVPEPEQEEHAMTDSTTKTGGAATSVGGHAGGGGGGGSSADAYTDARWNKLYYVAVGLVLFFGAVAVFLLTSADDPSTSETVWNRRVYAYGAVEAIAFTAVGWLFGREVNRKAAENATKQADAASKEAASARSEASNRAVDAAAEGAKGRALAAAVITSADAADVTRLELTADAKDAVLPVNRSQLESLKRYAQSLYPHVERLT